MTRGWMGWLGALSAAVALVACGGGGGDAGQPALGGGGGGNGAPTVDDIVLVLSKSTVANTGSDTVAITVTTVDKARNVVKGAPVTVKADGGAIVTAAASATDDSGRLQATLGIGADRSNRLITVTVTSGSRTQTAEVQVFGAKLSGTLVPAVVAPSQPGKVQYRLVDQAGNPMAAQAIEINAAGLTPASASGVTGASGEFEFSYTAGAAAGNVQITAQAGGTADTQVLQVQTTNTIPPVTTPVTSASVSANPSVVAVNLPGSTSNRTDIRAVFLGAGNVPIKDVRVRFDLAGDANAIGGSFSTGSEILYSNANGVVTTAYIPGTRSSPTDGVTVRACYAATDAALGSAASPLCPAAAFVTLTVVDEPLGVSIGTNELIIVNELTYVKKMVVAVVDAAGVAKPDVNIAVSVDLPRYRKGFYVLSGDTWVKSGGDQAVCDNEDANRNGFRDGGEDINGNGRLDPGKSDVSVSLLQTKTRADGTAELQIQYPKNFATWVDAVVTVAASGVAGTEGRASFAFSPVPADAASLKNKDVAPAYAVSPYGFAASCNNPN